MEAVLVVVREGAVVEHRFFCARCCGARKGVAVFVPAVRAYGLPVALGRSERHRCAGCGRTLRGVERGSC